MRLMGLKSFIIQSTPGFLGIRDLNTVGRRKLEIVWTRIFITFEIEDFGFDFFLKELAFQPISALLANAEKMEIILEWLNLAVLGVQSKKGIENVANYPFGPSMYCR